ncbi:ABC transporter substrate-binding protein [Thermodesulfobacteriota bacterium]
MKEKWYVLVIALMITVFVFAGNIVLADQKPKTVAELALYKGADRQQILEEGAKKEGKIVFYTSAALRGGVRPLVNAFQKKYPYIKVEFWRSSPLKVVPKVLEEYKVGRFVVDVIGLPQGGQIMLEEAGILQPFYSPELAYIEADAIRRAPDGGVFSAGHYVSAKVLGYNTSLITREELPKTYQELLDPKWKGEKVTLSGGTGTVVWMGVILETYGEDFARRMAKQDFVLQMVTSMGVLDMIIAGEYLFSPTMSDSQVNLGKKKGAPVDWIPLEPAVCYLNQIMLPKRAANPHAVMLYIDFDLSKEAGEIYKANGYFSPRKDVPSETTYKKYYGPFSTKQFNKWLKLYKELYLDK